MNFPVQHLSVFRAANVKRFFLLHNAFFVFFPQSCRLVKTVRQ